jgi:hypothetical protein
MSHLQELAELKKSCETTGDCTAYQTQLRQEESQVDRYIDQNNQMVLTGGTVVAIISLVVLLTPFIPLLKRFQVFLLPKLLIISPVLVGLIGGAIVGFIYSFGTCFKQTCSPIESSAMLSLPALSLFITIPLAIKIFKHRQAMANSLRNSKPNGWVVAGLILLALTLIQTAGSIISNNNYNARQKEMLRNSEL